MIFVNPIVKLILFFMLKDYLLYKTAQDNSTPVDSLKAPVNQNNEELTLKDCLLLGGTGLLGAYLLFKGNKKTEESEEENEK